MRLCSGWKSANRGFVFLAPPQAPIDAFDRTIEDPAAYSHLLAQAQRLRGRIYVEDGAIERQDLTVDGRHIQEADARSWHLLEVDECQRVTACLRYFPHSPGTSFQELGISHSALAQSRAFRSEVREAVEAELEFAAQSGLDYFEIGGWAISEEFRGTCDALRMVLCVYALAQLGGGALGLSTATTRHHSSSILKRIGARPLMAGGEAIRPYYDPQYGCEMELLSFDSALLNPKYAERTRELCCAVPQLPVLSLQSMKANTVGILQLDKALQELAHRGRPDRLLTPRSVTASQPGGAGELLQVVASSHS